MGASCRRQRVRMMDGCCSVRTRRQLVSRPTGSCVTSKALPVAAFSDPHLRHRHPVGLRLITPDHHIGHLGIQDCGITADNDLGAPEVLGAPACLALRVATDVLLTVVGLTYVRRPPEVLVQEAIELLGITLSERDRSGFGRPDDLEPSFHVLEPVTGRTPRHGGPILGMVS